MKRLGRWALNALTVLSLLLCVAVVGLWVRAHWRCDAAAWRVPGRMWMVMTAPGQFAIGGYRTSEVEATMLPPGWYYEGRRPTAQARGLADDVRTAEYRVGFGGLYFIKGFDVDVDAVGSAWAVTLPWWLLALAFAIRPAVAGVRWYRRPRPGPGVCRTCRYDLTGNVSGVCPECGSPIGRAA